MLGGVILVLNIDYSTLSLNWYDLFFIASALAITVNAFIIKNALNNQSESGDRIAYYNNFTVMTLFLISTLIAGDFARLSEVNFSFLVIFLIILGGVAQSLIFIFYYRNLKYFPVRKLQLFLLTVPVITCFIGVFAFDEKINFLQIIGICIILMGAAFIIGKDLVKQKKSEVKNEIN